MAYADMTRAAPMDLLGRLSDRSGQPDRWVHAIVQIWGPTVKSIWTHEPRTRSGTGFDLCAGIRSPVGLAGRQFDLELSPEPT